jgi:glutamate racemase
VVLASTELPIGVFDSGYGGLTVARAILDQLPHESVVYFGDTARQPYGPRPIAQVRAFALECLDSLVADGVKVLVIACNSASAAVLHDARERYAPLPVVEVIRPAVRRAIAATRNGLVGVICTVATATSGAYADAFGAVPDIRVSTRACPALVDFVEAGITGGPELLTTVHDYLDPLVADGIDTLVLGCTHYPLLSAAISYVVGPQITLVSSAEETAIDLYRLLAEQGLANRGDALPEHRFLTTGDPTEFTRLARRFLGPEAARAESVALPVS